VLKDDSKEIYVEWYESQAMGPTDKSITPGELAHRLKDQRKVEESRTTGTQKASRFYAFASTLKQAVRRFLSE